MAQASAVKNYKGVWDNRLGFGGKSALLVIDLLQGYTLKGAPLFAPGVVAAVKEMPELLKLRQKRSIIHTGCFKPLRFRRRQRLDQEGTRAEVALPQQVRPVLQGVERRAAVVCKNYASCFFGVDRRHADGHGHGHLLITGCTTSGHPGWRLMRSSTASGRS